MTDSQTLYLVLRASQDRRTVEAYCYSAFEVIDQGKTGWGSNWYLVEGSDTSMYGAKYQQGRLESGSMGVSIWETKEEALVKIKEISEEN